MSPTANNAEDEMVYWIDRLVSPFSTITLVGEPNVSRLSERLGSHKVVEIMSEENPMTKDTVFRSDVVIGTRPCDFAKGDLSVLFLERVEASNKKFILLPCNCAIGDKPYAKKFPMLIRNYLSITSVDTRNGWVILHNL